MTLAVLCLSLVVISVDNTILNVALPSIVRDLGAEGSQLQWIIDSYTIVFAGMLLTAGALGDRFGRKKALTAGLVMFGVFSALASRVDVTRDAHRRPGAHGDGRRVHLPDDAVDPDQHVLRPRAGPRDRHLGGRRRPRHRASVRSVAASCSSTSGGDRCSS